MAADARVGPYRILRLVNRGGQGSVYLGYDQRLHRRVAIKIYTLPTARAARRRLLREAQLVARIQSPKVVQIHDVIKSSDHLAMVMEYVPGCDLEDFLAGVRPSVASILTIAADIAGALAIARQQHIVHGDLKAGNILIAATGRVKLTDFGIAHGSPAGRAMLTGAGSLSAISPEQYLGKPVDARSDLFALGCLLYRMLTGVKPFYRGGQLDPQLLLEQVPAPLEELVAADAILPGELVALVTGLLQKDPRDRPASTGIVRRALRRAAAEVPLAAANSLLREARPYFRRESAEDIPPSIPTGLGRHGRSRLAQAGGAGGGPWRGGWRRGFWAFLGVSLVAAVTLLLVRPHAPLRVNIEPPVMRLGATVQLPGEVSTHWLVEQVAQALAEQLDGLQLTGPPGLLSATLSAATGRKQPAPAQEQVQFGLRCVELLCIFTVTRSRQGQHSNEQAVLFADMSVQQWRDIVRATTRALYP